MLELVAAAASQPEDGDEVAVDSVLNHIAAAEAQWHRVVRESNASSFESQVSCLDIRTLQAHEPWAYFEAG